MISGALIYGLIIGILLSGAARLVERALRLSGLPARLVWAVALVATLTVPVWAVREARARAGGALVAEVIENAGGVAPEAPPSAARLPALRLPSVLRRFDGPLAMAWIVVSCAIAAATAIGLARLARERRSWRAVRLDGHTVRISERFGPAVFGVVRPEIVLPDWALELSTADRRLILAHEDEHRRARDPALLALGAASVALAPLNPCIWWQARRLRAAVELDCDRRVLRRGAEPVAYGRLLLRIGSRTLPDRAFPLPVPALKETTGSILERRLRMITYERGKGWTGRVGLAAAAAVVLVVIACEAPTPTVSESKSAPMTLHQPMATPPALPGDVVMGKPLVFVDGEPVAEIAVPGPPEQRNWKQEPPRGDIRMWGLDPDKIERIEVIKGARAAELYGDAGKNGVVQITTKAAAPVAESRVASVEDAPVPALAPPPDGASKVRLELGKLPPGSVVVVDGEESDVAELSLNRADIERIEVVKGSAAGAIHPGAEQIVYITTKK